MGTAGPASLAESREKKAPRARCVMTPVVPKWAAREARLCGEKAMAMALLPWLPESTRRNSSLLCCVINTVSADVTQPLGEFVEGGGPEEGYRR